MTPIPPTTGRSAASKSDGTNDSPRDWYYRIGERERGPLTLVELKELAAASGDVAREIEVRHQAQGEWVPYASIDEETAKRLRDDRFESKPPRVAAAREQHTDELRTAPSAATFSARITFLRERIGFGRLIAGALVLAIVNVVLWVVVDPLHSTEHKYYQALADAAQKAHDARAHGLDTAARGRMAASVVQSIKPIVADLKKTANASDPVRQHLLWAATDQLPKLFSADGKELDECEGIFQRNMYEAGQGLGINVSWPGTSVVLP